MIQIFLFSKIPILEAYEDVHIWHFFNNGCYTVKSGYHVCMDFVVDNNNARTPGTWGKLWKLKVLPKVKHCLWCICHGYLPARKLLQVRLP